MMTPATLNAILNSAPMIIEGASRLVRLIRERGTPEPEPDQTHPATIDGLQEEMARVQTRLNENYQSDLEQIRLIEQLARQNESLAETLQQTLRRVTLLGYVSCTALLIAVGLLVYLLIAA